MKKKYLHWKENQQIENTNYQIEEDIYKGNTDKQLILKYTNNSYNSTTKKGLDFKMNRAP